MNLSVLEKYIIKTLAYYDIFSYPLTAEEIYLNLRVNHTTAVEVQQLLDRMVEKKILHRIGNYYLLKDDQAFVTRRERGNNLAARRLKTARRMSRLISKFPFVRAILLSGSLSKGFMEEDSDIDYFVVTQPNRLWFSRTLLMLFKKIFLLNSKKMFCINYFVDSENLEISEKNIFTATEIATLIPTFGASVYEELYSKNIWIRDYFPNLPKRQLDGIIAEENGTIKPFFEKMLGSKIGDKLDDFFMSLFEKHNRKKYSTFNRDDFQLAFKSSKKESKHHPLFFQKKVLNELEKKIKMLEEKLQTSLN